jgi:hypothetical protein
MKDTCLCVAVGTPGKQTVGYWTSTGTSSDWIFVATGERTCRICLGTRLCPAWRRDHGLPTMDAAWRRANLVEVNDDPYTPGGPYVP